MPLFLPLGCICIKWTSSAKWKDHEIVRAKRGSKHTFCLRKSWGRGSEGDMVAKGKESLKWAIKEGPDLPPLSSKAVKSSAEQMMININHVCVTLREERKPYCSLNEPWLCWPGLTNGVRLWVGDPDKWLKTVLILFTAFPLCRLF